VPSAPPIDLETLLTKIVGMESLKARLREFARKIKRDVAKRKAGHETLTSTYHMWITGNPGTGKTTVARILHGMLQSAGVLTVNAPFIEFKPSDAEGSAMGEAREKTKEYIEKANGGVLFADEAHNITKDKENMYGKQVAQELMNCLHTGNVTVIYAGYPKEMVTLMKSDPGYTRRIPTDNRFELADYTPIELAEIFLKKAEGKKRVLGEGVTVKSVAKLIDMYTSEEQRSQLNGSIAERLLEKTEAAMDARDGESMPSQLVYELADVTTGASSMDA